MDIFPLPIFPPGSLSSSVITTVWVGVFVLVFFNLRLGWVLSGLVVPGYMVPLWIMKPWAAVVISVEAIITYALVWLFSEYLSRWGRWSNFFGRDRFFALVHCSVVIRLVSDAWLLPLLGDWLTSYWDWQFDYRSNLHSFGLIIIAMIANQFWKTGFVRGLPQLAITCAITYLIVRFGLMEYTNFTMSNLGYMYEDFAASILGSPKAYIIILTTALLSSRLNLHYGWDFNGILVPSLIALQWSQPLRILTSFVEAYCILSLANIVLRMPVFQRMTIEGGRKLLLFFNISFAYKVILGYALVWTTTSVKVTDFFGFGYLLPTLMAVKMHDKDIIARLTRATLQTSLVAVLLACGVGFALTYLPTFQTWTSPGAAEAVLPPRQLTETALSDLLRRDKSHLYRSQVATSVAQPLPHEIDLFRAAVRILKAQLITPNPRLLNQAQALLVELDYQIDVIEKRYLYVHEQGGHRGWGSYVIDLVGAENELLIAVPTPLDDRATLEAAIALFVTHPSRALAIAGVHRESGTDPTFNVLRTPHSFFHVFHKEVAKNNVLQVRSAYQSSTHGKRRGDSQSSRINQDALTSSIWVKSTLPPGLDLVKLKALVHGFRVTWDAPPWPNVQRDDTRMGFAELFLTPSSSLDLLFRPILPHLITNESVPIRQLKASLSSWLLQLKNQIASLGSDLYQEPKLAELLLLDAEILTPIFQLLDREQPSRTWSDAVWNDLHAVAITAQSFGYNLVHIQDGEDEYVALVESLVHDRPRNYWGTYVWRIGPSRPFFLQVPHPLFETNSFDYAVSLFNRLRGRSLMVGGAHPRANADGSAELLSRRNSASLFNLAHQVSLRESGELEVMVVQSRGLSVRPGASPPAADVILSFANALTSPSALSPLGQGLHQTLLQEGLSVRFVDGSVDMAGYESSGVVQAKYLDAIPNKEFVQLWLSPQTRARYRQQSLNRLQEAQFRALQLSTIEAELSAHITAQSDIGQSDRLPGTLRNHLMNYIKSQDIIHLRQLALNWPSYRFQRVVDTRSQQAYLLVYRDMTHLALVVNLSLKTPEYTVQQPILAHDLQPAIRRFVDARSRWLEWVVE